MKGTYVLIIKLTKNSTIKIGKLGNIQFSKGYYCYVGSAFGKRTSLENRIRRHKKLNNKKEDKLKWHIDYFLVNPNAFIEKAVAFNEKKIEFKISRRLLKHAEMAINGFGCSDCKCKSHFYYFGEKVNESLFSKM